MSTSHRASSSHRPSNGESSTDGATTSNSTTTNHTGGGSSSGRRSRSRPGSAGAASGGGAGGSGRMTHTQEGSGSAKSHRPPVRIGQYTMQQTLGTGSFGKVKLATHSLTGHRVAMKIINRRKISTLEMGGRVKREIQYLKLLRHPHIIKLYEVITTPNDIIMVIEYAGGELFQYIVDRGRMSEDEARRFFQQIICAIEYCHRHKIVHRDLKPENLLLDEFLNVKIGDFGLSNIMTDGDFLKTSCGSPNYAAPEVISGKLYAGPEIDIWSCGVILYVMLCGRLPFDDEYIPTLFKKINGGIYTLPSYLSPEAKHLLSSMLVVDPVKRITIAEIRQLPWFNQGLPSYLQPLPPTPAAEPSGFDFSMSTSAGADADGSEDGPVEARELYGPGVGILEEEIVAELSEKMMGFSHEDVLQHLLEPGDNQVKVAYQLVRDHKKLLQSAHLGEKKEMQGFLATSPPPWNAGLDELMSRSTSIKRKGGRSRAGTGAPKPQPQLLDGGATTDDAGETSADPDAGNATDEANETFGSDDGGLTEDDSSDEDDEEPHTPAECGIALLRTSLHRGDIGPGGQPSGAPPPAPAPTPKKSRSRWHFGIRSRSPPMEIMLELYRTLQVLGMEWKADPDLETDGRGSSGDAGDGAAPSKGGPDDEAIKGEALFFLQTRWKVHNIIVRMNLQLYRVDASNYLVDFRNVGYVRLDPDPIADPSSPPSASDESGGGGAGGTSGSQLDSASLHSALDQASAHAALRGKASLAPSVPEGRKEVCSPFLFLECATRLIVELAGGG